MKIHCIGDSHASFFGGLEKIQPRIDEDEKTTNQYPFFNSYRIGPATAYQLHNKQTIIETLIDNLHLDDADKLMFCFGEVDIRAHLIKQSNLQKRNINDIVYECVSRYISSVSYYLKYNRRILIWGPIASWSNKKPYSGPSYGSNLERNYVTRIFNGYLSDLCLKNNFQFVSIFEEMLNSDGTTNPHYIMDDIHLSQKAMPMTIEKFKNLNLID
jgi:hypothetical protein